VDDLIEGFKPLKAKMLSIMLVWKPNCFNINDAAQELQTL
jgi:hypothetical protein